MKIDNATVWDTLQLRAVFTRVAVEMRKTEGKLRHKLKVRVRYKRNSTQPHVLGRAYLNSGLMWITTPHPDHCQINVRDLAHTFMHELLHCYGVEHQKMTAAQMQMIDDGAEFAYVDGLMVERKVAKPKVKKADAGLLADVQVIRYTRIMAQVQRNEAKAKRLAAAHRKLTIKRRYYERALAADGRLALLSAKSG